MTLKPSIWHPIAIALSAINLAAGGFAAGLTEPLHAAVHAGLALAFGLWARRLRQGSAGDEDREGLEALMVEVGDLRQELGEAQERLDFAERLLAQRPEARRMGPEQ